MNIVNNIYFLRKTVILRIIVLRFISVMVKMLQFIHKYRGLVFILSLAAFLRIYGISENPKAMYGDELTLVYDAYSILQTGHDQKGNFLPFFFSMGGGRPAAYIYATIPFTAFFGPTALAARSVSILSGLGIVFLLYLICKRILTEKVGLYAALLATIAPWELSLSRGGFETHLALFLSLAAFYLFLRAQKNPYWYLASGLSFALSMQTYLTYVVNIPLFSIFLFGWGRKKFKWQFVLFSLLIIISFALSISISISRGSKDRVSNLLTFNSGNIQNITSAKVKTERNYSLLEPNLAYKLHNRYLENINIVTLNYAKSLSLEFLFLSGDGNPRHNPAQTGQLFWAFLPLIVVGGLTLFLKSKKLLLFLLLWVGIAPSAAAFVGSPHALRNSFLLPPLLILAASGVERLGKAKFFLVVLFIIQAAFFIERFYFLSPNLNASFWSYSAKKASIMALENKEKFKYIFLSTSIPDMEFAYPVYAKIKPADFQYQDNHKSYFGEFAFYKFDNVYIGSIPGTKVREVMQSLKGSVFYLGPIDDIGKLDNEKIQRDEDEQPLFAISTKDN